MRFITIIAFGFWVGLAVLIYQIKHETRALEARSALLSKSIQEERENIAVTRAEWGHVTRPENVEKLAREVLKFEPLQSSQIVEWKAKPKTPAGPRIATPAAKGVDAIAALIGRQPKRGAGERTHAPR